MAEPERTILVVDDEDRNRELLERRLARRGYRVLLAEDGYKAIGMVEAEDVDLVLLDIMMPGIDGLRVLEKLREKHPLAALPVVMASALDDSDTVVKALEAGANDYVTKPLDFPVVMARVEAQLRRKSEVAQPAEPAPDSVGPGAVLGGRYRIEQSLGEGGFGRVYRAHHLELELDVALKVLNPDMVRSPRFLARFRREGVSTCRVQHPNAVNVYDIHASEDGLAYLVMELLRGATLSDALSLSGPLTPARCAEILTPVCDVLAEAHRAGVIHRDIKPENLYLHRTPQGEVVKVLDFGIAGVMDEAESENITQHGMVLGTLHYMAPERIAGGAHDGRADVFSLGVLLHRMLTGTEAYQGMTTHELLARHESGTLPEFGPEVPEKIAVVVRQALRADPRIPSARISSGSAWSLASRPLRATGPAISSTASSLPLAAGRASEPPIFRWRLPAPPAKADAATAPAVLSNRPQRPRSLHATTRSPLRGASLHRPLPTPAAGSTASAAPVIETEPASIWSTVTRHRPSPASSCIPAPARPSPLRRLSPDAVTSRGSSAGQRAVREPSVAACSSSGGSAQMVDSSRSASSPLHAASSCPGHPGARSMRPVADTLPPASSTSNSSSVIPLGVRRRAASTRSAAAPPISMPLPATTDDSSNWPGVPPISPEAANLPEAGGACSSAAIHARSTSAA